MNYKKGFFLIEALLSIVIFTMLLLSIFSMISFLQRRVVVSSFDSEAALLLQDGAEITHSALLSDWNAYADGVYFPVLNVNTGTWVLVHGEEELEARYKRKIELRRVCRNQSTGERIAYSSVCSGEIDNISREVVVTISWENKGEEEILESSLLVVNYNYEQ